MNKIQPIKRSSISEVVCDQLKEYLLEGYWKPGEKIPSENELAQSFNVSRVSIREALLRLTSLGLLDSKFSGGTYVREITPGLNLKPLVPVAYLGGQSILDVMEYRQVVEVKTAGLAARRADAEDIAELERIWEQMEKHKHTHERFAKEDLNFHFQIARITGNSLLIETLNIIRSVLSQAMSYAIQQRGYSQGLSCHRLLIEAISGHDEEASMRIMDEHTASVYESTKAQLALSGNDSHDEETRDVPACSNTVAVNQKAPSQRTALYKP